MRRKAGLKQGLAGVITGASSGIGRALAVVLAAEFKAKLVLNARNKTGLEETAELVRESGGQAVLVTGDVGDRHIAESLPGTCVQQFGSIDILVNNAGLAKPGPLSKLSPDDWHQVFQVNFFAAVYTICAGLPYLLKQRSGKIVNVASVAGKVAFPGSVCYSASKFALTGLSEGMAAELESQGIDVITVCPGWVRSEFFSKNHMPDDNNPTLIAKKKDFDGWLMRNFLSISSHECAEEILKACEKGGAQEIVLTGPGIIVERLAAVLPGLRHTLVSKVPPER